MKKVLVGMLACWAAWQVTAAEADWQTDFSKAQAKAKAENKLILMDFNGSDWCPPCKALRKTVFSSPEFIDYAKKNLILVDVDFPRQKTQTEEQKKANQQLSEQFNIEGYPTVIVLTKDGKQLKKSVGYDGENPKEYITELEKAKKDAPGS